MAELRYHERGFGEGREQGGDSSSGSNPLHTGGGAADPKPGHPQLDGLHQLLLLWVQLPFVQFFSLGAGLLLPGAHPF